MCASVQAGKKEEMQRYRFNPITLMYEVYEGPRYLRYVRAVLGVAAVVALALLYFWLYTSVLGLDLPKTALLKKENARWQGKLAVMNRHLDLYEDTLEAIEERDDEVYRSIFGLNAVPAEVKNSGFGGINRYEYLDKYGADPSLKQTLKRIDMLTKRTYVQSMALDDVYAISVNAGDMKSHIPSVPPLLPDNTQVHISSTFGGRFHPVLGYVKFHEGMDFATRVGYPVYATGDAVVEKVIFQFTGYGNEVVLDHGFGYKTRYAHLSGIDVAAGMTVHRGDRIGSVGNTGISTGPHLHYEVIYKGNRINPYHFLDMDMPTEEYRAMTERRRAEATPRRKSTNELLQGRGN